MNLFVVPSWNLYENTTHQLCIFTSRLRLSVRPWYDTVFQFWFFFSIIIQYYRVGPKITHFENFLIKPIPTVSFRLSQSIILSASQLSNALHNFYKHPWLSTEHNWCLTVIWSKFEAQMVLSRWSFGVHRTFQNICCTVSSHWRAQRKKLISKLGDDE